MTKNIAILFFCIVFCACLGACKIIKEKPDASTLIEDELNCGLDTSLLMSDKPLTKVYPDITLILKNKEVLSLSNRQIEALNTAARECFERCELDKNVIQMKEIQIRQRYKPKPGFSLHEIAPQLNEIKELREKWLAQHTKRFEEAIENLNPEQRQKLQKILKNNR